MHTYSFKEDLNDLFKKSNIKNGFFHSVRFPDLFTFSRVLSDANSKVFLISHGSHTIQKKIRYQINMRQNLLLQD